MLLSPKRIAGTVAILSVLALAGPALAQTTTGTTYPSSSSTTGTTGIMTSTTPGAPNTGAGGDTTQNLLLLGISGLVVVAGGAYLARVGTQAR